MGSDTCLPRGCSSEMSPPTCRGEASRAALPDARWAPSKFRAPLSPRRAVARRRRRLVVPDGTPVGGWGGGWAGVLFAAWKILAADRGARAVQLAGRGGRQPDASRGRGRPPGGHPRAPSHRVYLRGVCLRGGSGPTKMLAGARPAGCLHSAADRLDRPRTAWWARRDGRADSFSGRRAPPRAVREQQSSKGNSDWPRARPAAVAP